MILCPEFGVKNKETAKFCLKYGATFQKEDSKIPEDIDDRRTIVCKPLVDPSKAKIVAEQEKTKLFSKHALFKPKPEEVQFTSFEKVYESYIIENGVYNIKPITVYMPFYKAVYQHLKTSELKTLKINGINANIEYEF